MRALFASYLLIVWLGIVYFIAVGLLHR